MSVMQSIQDGKFGIMVEFTPHSRGEVEHIAEIAKGLPELNKKYAEHNIVFTGISLTQNPGGRLAYDHQASLAIFREKGVPDEIEMVPHITGKDMNTDAVRALLISLSEMGVETILALTGDQPLAAKGVFEIDALGLLSLVREINIGLLQKKKTPEDFAAASILNPGAAVSPFKYVEGSLEMQIIKAWKKAAEGARYLTCQAGWDANRSELLIKRLEGIGIPTLGNVLVVNKAAGNAMKTLPGCVITDAFLEKMTGEKFADSLTRASQQMAMFQQLGYGGIDLGKPVEFKKVEHLEQIVDGALEIKDWREFKDNITFAPVESRPLPMKNTASFSKFVHGLILEKEAPLYGLTKAVLSLSESSRKKNGFIHRCFKSNEEFGKGLMYECGHCGDCFLPENEYVCTMGGCEKGLDNPPCGDAEPDGICGNDPEKVRICVGERLFHRLKEYNSLEAYREAAPLKRDPMLQDTASLLNFYFDRDHNKERINPLEGSGLIQIAELVHASIPLPGAALKYLQNYGEGAFTKPNRGLAVLEHIIRTQAEEGADFIDINVDALGGDTITMMKECVRVVHRAGLGTPPCIDSSDIKVLQAGLNEWFSLGDVAAPLLNSITYIEKDNFGPILELRKQHKFSAVCLLVGEEGPLKTSDEMVDAAREMFGILSGAGFAANEILYDCVTLGIASDGCMDGMGMVKPSHTHASFHAIRRITGDAQMKGVHAVLGVSNWVYGAKRRRIGHIRAFIAVAQKYGLDGAILDTAKQFGCKPASKELMDFVQMYVDLDGSDDSMMTYSMKMQEARAGNMI